MLTEMLLEEHSRSNIDRVASIVENNPLLFSELISCLLLDDKTIPQRAAWVMRNIVDKHPHLIDPYLQDVVELLHKQGIHDGIKRNVFSILQHISIPESLHGEVADLSFEALKNKEEAIAIRVFAMTLFYRFVVIYPDLKNDLKVIIEEEMPYASAGFRSRAEKILNQLNASQAKKRYRKTL